MRFSYSWVAILIAIGCGSTAEPSVQPAAAAHEPTWVPTRVLTGKFGECNAGCRFDFRELEAERPRVVQTYCRAATPECISFEGVLTAAGRARMKELGELLAAAPLEERYGCGTCVDGSDDTLVLDHKGGPVTEHSYDAQREHEVPALKAAQPVLRSLHSAFYTCTSSELIQIGSDCTPYEKLSPRPGSRP